MDGCIEYEANALRTAVSSEVTFGDGMGNGTEVGTVCAGVGTLRFSDGAYAAAASELAIWWYAAAAANIAFKFSAGTMGAGPAGVGAPCDCWLRRAAYTAASSGVSPFGTRPGLGAIAGGGDGIWESEGSNGV